MDVGLNLAALMVGVINAIAALLAGYVAYREYRKGENDGRNKPPNTPKNRSVRSGIRPGRVRNCSMGCYKGKFRRFVSAYCARVELSILSAG